MNIKLAVEIADQLKADGYNVSVEGTKNRFIADDTAILGDWEMTDKAVKACCDYIRKTLCPEATPTPSKPWATRSAGSRSRPSRPIEPFSQKGRR